MKTLRGAFGLGVFLALGAAAIAAPADGPREVEALERELVAAIGSGDLATYDRIVADDYVAFEASGKTTPKKDILECYRSGARHYTNLEIFDVEGRVFGDTAVVTPRRRACARKATATCPIASATSASSRAAMGAGGPSRRWRHGSRISAARPPPQKKSVRPASVSLFSYNLWRYA